MNLYHLSISFIYYVSFSNELTLAFFCWSIMIVSLDTRANNDVAFEDIANHGRGGLVSGLRAEIWLLDILFMLGFSGDPLRDYIWL